MRVTVEVRKKDRSATHSRGLVDVFDLMEEVKKDRAVSETLEFDPQAGVRSASSGFNAAAAGPAGRKGNSATYESVGRVRASEKLMTYERGDKRRTREGQCQSRLSLLAFMPRELTLQSLKNEAPSAAWLRTHELRFLGSAGARRPTVWCAPERLKPCGVGPAEVRDAERRKVAVASTGRREVAQSMVGGKLEEAVVGEREIEEGRWRGPTSSRREEEDEDGKERKMEEQLWEKKKKKKEVKDVPAFEGSPSERARARRADRRREPPITMQNLFRRPPPPDAISCGRPRKE